MLFCIGKLFYISVDNCFCSVAVGNTEDNIVSVKLNNSGVKLYHFLRNIKLVAVFLIVKSFVYRVVSFLSVCAVFKLEESDLLCGRSFAYIYDLLFSIVYAVKL